MNILELSDLLLKKEKFYPLSVLPAPESLLYLDVQLYSKIWIEVVYRTKEQNLLRI